MLRFRLSPVFLLHWKQQDFPGYAAFWNNSSLSNITGSSPHWGLDRHRNVFVS